MFLSHCHVFPVLSPVRFIFLDVAVMTRYNSPCQTHQDAWFAGMSMSSVSLKTQTTEMAQWPCGAECAVCMYPHVCLVLWPCIKPLAHACCAHVPLQLCGCEFVGAFASAQPNKSTQVKCFCHDIYIYITGCSVELQACFGWLLLCGIGQDLWICVGL